jgi:hypothetical protein
MRRNLAASHLDKHGAPVSRLTRQPLKSRTPAKTRQGGANRRRIRKTGSFLTKAKAAAAVSDFIKAHPNTFALTISIQGKKVVVKALKPADKSTRKNTIPCAPRGYFAPFYTSALAAEDNQLAAHSVPFDPADFPE